MATAPLPLLFRLFACASNRGPWNERVHVAFKDGGRREARRRHAGHNRPQRKIIGAAVYRAGVRRPGPGKREMLYRKQQDKDNGALKRMLLTPCLVMLPRRVAPIVGRLPQTAAVWAPTSSCPQTPQKAPFLLPPLMRPGFQLVPHLRRNVPLRSNIWMRLLL